MFENWTFEEWQTELNKKHQNLYKLVNELIPELWMPLEFELSVFKILNIKDCTLPFAGILLGATSSLKTVGIEYSLDKEQTSYDDILDALRLSLKGYNIN